MRIMYNQQLVNMKNIKSIGSEYEEYLHDESRLTGVAEYLVFARSEEDIRETLRFCKDNKFTLTIQGSRTGITGGSVPEGGLILNLERMNRIRGIRQDENGNYFLRCEPGLKLAELREILTHRQLDTSDFSPEEHLTWNKFTKAGRYIFPPDPTETTASLGGMASCNASGARNLKYGATRQWISNLKVIRINEEQSEAILPDYGERFNFNNVKNAAGYYLGKSARDFEHYIGAEGTLGIISELEIKLIRKPEHCWGVMQFFAGEIAAVNFSEKLRMQKYAASAIEYFDNNALDLLRINRQLWDALPEMQNNWAFGIYYEYEGDDEELLEEAVFSAGELAEEFGSSDSDCWFVNNDSGIEHLKEFRHAVPEAINEELDKLRRKDNRIAKISTDLAVPDGNLQKLLSIYRQAEQSGWRVIVFGHIGNNHLHTNILPANYAKYLEGRQITESWAKLAVEMGGSVSGEHGIGKIKRGLLKLMYGSEGMRIFRHVKELFDPEWLLNRGNIIER